MSDQAQALSEEAQVALDRLLKLARTYDPRRHQQAKLLLLELPQEQRQHALLVLTADATHVARELALELLPETLDEHPAFAHDLLSLARDANEGAKQVVVIALRERESHRAALEPLVRAWSEDDGDDLRYQAMATRELWREDDKEYRKLLIKRLEDHDAEIRIIAAQGLSRLKATEALPNLRDAFERGAHHERFHHLLALATLGEEELWPHFEVAMRRAETRFAAILAVGDHNQKPAIPKLLKTAKAWLGDPLSKVASARSAALLGAEEGVTLLLRFLQSRRPEARGYAFECLVEVATENASLITLEQLLNQLPEKRPIDPDLLIHTLHTRRTDATTHLETLAAKDPVFRRALDESS